MKAGNTAPFDKLAALETVRVDLLAGQANVGQAHTAEKDLRPTPDRQIERALVAFFWSVEAAQAARARHAPSGEVFVLRHTVSALRGSAYEGVTLRHVMTMSSGVRWNEDYTDRNSDVNRYSKSLADKVPGGVLRLMASLPRAHQPGATFLYNSGDTYLLGAALTQAIGKPLADYMSEKIWRPAGMECDAFYTLESEGGQEIGGSRAGMVLRDFGRFGHCLMTA